ncbi:cell wall hydrolase [Alkaliphilus sp. B6464]|uniref:cell wall hydrolase n=1 Tax=Alkaliphilus sp. B6464 TaxID=2731219 RepID=UPI001BA58833|nr:cell wall hydrolase [Alkaliphilus sp. B6464]QUH22126.1 cell wall hydrolase [Alkaliphilus sp. B6464]
MKSISKIYIFTAISLSLIGGSVIWAYSYSNGISVVDFNKEKTQIEEKIVLNRMNKYVAYKTDNGSSDYDRINELLSKNVTLQEKEVQEVKKEVEKEVENKILAKEEEKPLNEKLQEVSIEDEKMKKLLEIKENNLDVKKEIIQDITKSNKSQTNYAKDSKSITTSKINIATSDKEILERIVQAEASGESFEGKRAVATVVMNRVGSTSFPNTIKEVVFAPRQFSPISDGNYYKVTISTETRKAVEDVLNGYRSFDSAVVYFCNPKTSTSRWMIDNRPYVATIGNHAFYK